MLREGYWNLNLMSKFSNIHDSECFVVQILEHSDVIPKV